MAAVQGWDTVGERHPVQLEADPRADLVGRIGLSKTRCHSVRPGNGVRNDQPST